MSAKTSVTHRFERLVASGVTLVDFGANWCDPCRAQAPIIRTLKKNFSSMAQIKIIDIEKNCEIAHQLGIQSIPTIIIYQNGREVKRFIGLQSGETLGRALKQLV
jgi:thioredoxin 1